MRCWQVALRALSMGVVDIEQVALSPTFIECIRDAMSGSYMLRCCFQVGTAGGTYEGEWMVSGLWHLEMQCEKAPSCDKCFRLRVSFLSVHVCLHHATAAGSDLGIRVLHQDGEWHGFGAFSAANGDVYLGEYARGKRHGRGMIEYALGGFYRGSWRDGKQVCS